MPRQVAAEVLRQVASLSAKANKPDDTGCAAHVDVLDWALDFVKTKAEPAFTINDGPGGTLACARNLAVAQADATLSYLCRPLCITCCRPECQ